MTFRAINRLKVGNTEQKCGSNNGAGNVDVERGSAATEVTAATNLRINVGWRTTDHMNHIGFNHVHDT